MACFLSHFYMGYNLIFQIISQMLRSAPEFTATEKNLVLQDVKHTRLWSFPVATEPSFPSFS